MCFQFEGQAGEEFQEQASQLCSQHSQAVELIKNKKRKDPRFAQIIQVHTHKHTLLDMLWLGASGACVTCSGVRGQSSLPEAAAEGPAGVGDAQDHQVPPAAGQDH